MTYCQLTREERYQIRLALKYKKSNLEIGKLLRRHRSTIWRERKRNTGQNGYRPLQAQQWTKKRRGERVYFRKMTPELQFFIGNKLLLQWSPEQICGRLRLEGHKSVCPETIYRWIQRNQNQGGSLWTHLRTANKIRRKRIKIPSNRVKMADRLSIKHRPKIVAGRKRIGDFERDTMVGERHKSWILTAVDRKSKLTLIAKLKNHDANEAHRATVELLKDQTVHTITNDNGLEFSAHQKTAEELKTKIYFTTPYTSQERGTNENTNGLIRQYFPKSTDLGQVSEERIKEVQNLLNYRPRKTLGYRTPHEVHHRVKLTYHLVALAM
jgi:transposase, IS30 family